MKLNFFSVPAFILSNLQFASGENFTPFTHTYTARVCNRKKKKRFSAIYVELYYNK